MKNLLLILCVALVSCTKDYSTKPSPFQKGEIVDFKEHDKQFDLIDCCLCPCVIDNLYIKAEGDPNWYYDVHDQHNFEVYNVTNTQLKKWGK